MLSIVGVPGAGKSTIFKQFVTIYGDGYPKETRSHYQPIIDHNVISQMQELLAIDDPNIPPISPTRQASAQFIRQTGTASPLSLLRVADSIAELMKDPSMPQRLELRNVANSDHFLPKVQCMATAAYVPSLLDIFYAYSPTKQNQNLSVRKSDMLVTCIDTASERAEIPVNTDIVFVVNLNNFTRAEAKSDAGKDLVLFEEVCNSTNLAKANISVFLNQKDRFRVCSRAQSELAKSLLLLLCCVVRIMHVFVT